MDNDINKIIKIFDKKYKTNLQDEDGIFYAVAEKDDNGNYFNAQHLTNSANMAEYLVQVMKIEDNKTRLYTYRITGEILVSFISRFSDDDVSQKIIEITKCQPKHLA